MGIVSSSAQTLVNLQSSGIYSSSAQLPAGLVSSSAQTLTNLQSSGIVSSSAQLPTASWASQSISSSWASQAISASFATTASYITNAQSASYVANAQTASYASVPLEELSDVTISSATANQVLMWNGVTWVNAETPETTVAGPGVVFYFDSQSFSSGGLQSLTSAPLGGTENADSVFSLRQPMHYCQRIPQREPSMPIKWMQVNGVLMYGLILLPPLASMALLFPFFAE